MVSEKSEKTSSFDLVIVCPHLGDGGSQRVITTLANNWSRSGRRICVITLFRDKAVYALDKDVTLINVQKDYSHKLNPSSTSIFQKVKGVMWGGLRFVGLDARFGKYYHYYNLIIYLRKALSLYKSGVVVSFIGSTNLMTILASRGLGRKVVISERNDPERQRLEQPWNWLRPILYKRADIVTANTMHALKTMRQYVQPEKLVFVPNPLLPKKNKDDGQKGTGINSAFILTVGRHHPQKAQDILLQAFQLLPKALAHWQLVLIGQGELTSHLQKFSRELGIAERVHWPGQIENPFPYYRSASIFALPSRHEGMSNALLEAMHCGLPAIVSDACPGSLELVKNNINGLVTPVDNPQALANAIVRLAEDENLRNSLGAAAKAYTADYELTTVLKKWETVLGI